ncbi:MAG: chorismate synthase [Bacteroidales bacterium]|nr:chorismate synthase [Bacteroidales bacterium]
MNSFGTLFRIQIFGESHGPAVGVCIDGCPPGVSLSVADFTPDLNRRRAGARGTTTRHEDDLPEIISGVYAGKTTGAPLVVLFANREQRPGDYEHLRHRPRPGHADFVASVRYKGFNDPRGGGHFSGRLTLPLVAAGVIAKKLLKDISISAALVEAGGRQDITAAVEEALNDGDSIGGLVECRAQNIPAGWGEPFFDSVESVISHLAFAIPAIKGIEFGSGFKAASMEGSRHNDAIISKEGKTATNHAGGISGGLTNGNELLFRVAVKPASSIAREQKSMNMKLGTVETLEVKGRHDACIALRVPVVAEAITAIALADFKLLAGNR